MLLTRTFKNLALIITFCLVLLPTFFVVTIAQTSLAQQYTDVCESKFKDKNDPDYVKYYKNLQDAQQYDLAHPQQGNITISPNGNTNSSSLLQAGCPPSLNDISTIVIRIITLLITVVGLIVFFNMVKAGFMYMTAGPNKDKIKHARGTIQGTIGGLFLIFISYALIVFIAVRLGLAGDPDKFSILDGPTLIFKFMFNY